MPNPYLDFKPAKCRDCYRCLRECPVKAIRYENRQATIIDDRCILCGHCTLVCPQNAKQVHSELDDIKALLSKGVKVVASVAPSFVSSFNLQDFSIMRQALKKLGFTDAEETSIGAAFVTQEYERLLKTKQYKNFITSACPATNRMIQLYYPKALKYLAPVPSPMIVHAKLIKEKDPDAHIIFIGPCIAKKREAKESGLIDGVLTFEDLEHFLNEKDVHFSDFTPEKDESEVNNKAKYYPIPRGIIKSFPHKFPEGYEYLAIDGVSKAFEVLEDIDELSGIFIEMNCCDHACINGPLSLKTSGGPLKKNEDVRRYAKKDEGKKQNLVFPNIPLDHPYEKLHYNGFMPSERDIKEVLAKTGKYKPEDELDCGACGYNTCREKAIAVLNGNADIEMCLPYMRSRAESMSYEIIQNTPNGIVVLDSEFKIIDINPTAQHLLGIPSGDLKGKLAYDLFDITDYVNALTEEKNIKSKKIHIEKTGAYVELTIGLISNQKIMFGVMKDITKTVEYDKKLSEMTDETLVTTDEVITKQMRVAQEIASLLGETTAETKVALLKLKETLKKENKAEGIDKE